MNRSYMCANRVEFLPVRSVVVSANVVILCWLCKKLAGALTCARGLRGCKEAARNLSSNTLPPARSEQKLGPGCAACTAHAGQNTRLNYSSVDRLTGQKYISPPPGLQCRHLSSRCLPRLTTTMVPAIIQWPSQSSNEMYLDCDAL